MLVADTPEQIQVVRYLVIRKAIQLYLKTDMLGNAAYTPKNMRASVTQLTGHSYQSSRKGTEKALADLNAWLQEKGMP